MPSKLPVAEGILAYTLQFMGKTRVSMQAACFQRGTEPGKRSNVASDVWIYGDLSEHHAFLVLLPVKINKSSVRNS